MATYVGWAALGAAGAGVWVARDPIADRAAAWWSPAVVAVVVAVAVLLVGWIALSARSRTASRKSVAHPTLQVRRGRHRSRPVRRPLGRRAGVANVFVDADSFASAAWPGAEPDTARRWTVDACERVSSRFGTDVAVIVGPGGARPAERSGVRVVAVAEGGSIRDALWDVVAPLDPELLMLLVTDDGEVASAATAHGALVMSCRNWMALADR